MIFCFSQVLTVGPCIEDRCVLQLAEAVGTDEQKWRFQSDDSIRGLTGLSVYLSNGDGTRAQVLGELNIVELDDTVKFRVVLADI